MELLTAPQVTTSSNCGPGVADESFLDEAAIAASVRRSEGYDAAGRCGGAFSAVCPPAGMCFGGYHKGCTGIHWICSAGGEGDSDEGYTTADEGDLPPQGVPPSGGPYPPHDAPNSPDFHFWVFVCCLPCAACCQRLRRPRRA